MAISELAAACGVDLGALDRVLRLLTTHGIFERQEGGYCHTPSSHLLRSDHPMTMRPFAQMMGLPFVWGSLTELKHSVRTGKPAIEVMEPKGVFAYLQDRPDEAAIFGRAMTAKASVDIGAVIAAYDFTSFGRIADIGGGRGHLLRAVLEATPGANGILFDLAAVIDTVTPRTSPGSPCRRAISSRRATQCGRICPHGSAARLARRAVRRDPERDSARGASQCHRSGSRRFDSGTAG